MKTNSALRALGLAGLGSLIAVSAFAQQEGGYFYGGGSVGQSRARIDSENVGSIRFHERCGFFEVARMPELGTKFGRRLDLVLMQRLLDAEAP